MAAIYFHVPFCKQACHYCNFHFSTSLKHKNPILYAMLTELKLRKAELPNNEEIKSIYFGGGTPSLLTPAEVMGLINEAKRNFNVAADAASMLVSSSLQLGPLRALQLTWPGPIVACAIDCFCCLF